MQAFLTSTLASALRDRGDYVTPNETAAGDIVYYPPQPLAPEGHVGIVVGRSGGVNVVEGNAGDAPGIVKYRTNPFGTYYFTRPNWPTNPVNARSRSMTTRFGKIGTGSGGLGTVVALAGDAGYPCAANWQEYTRNPADQSQLDRAAQEYKVHGEIVWIPAAQWDALKAAYTEAGPTAGIPQTVSLSPDDRALLVDIATKLEAAQP